MKKTFFNNLIKAEKVRVVGEKGENFGVFSLREALKIAQEKGLDLVQMTEKLEIPVCKITDYGKYAYNLQKKEKKSQKQSKTGLKVVRLRYNISLNDTETRIKAAEKFLNQGRKVKIEMFLRGREKAFQYLAREKMMKMIDVIKERFPIKIEHNIQRGGKGLVVIIAKK